MAAIERVAELKEIPNPESVFLLSPVSQPKWYPGGVDERRTEELSNKLRGDSIISNLRLATSLGYSVVIVHSPDENPAFLDALHGATVQPFKNKVVIQPQQITGYSQARREAISEAAALGSKVNVMLELEKPMIEYIPAMVTPILKGAADLTITDRQIITSGPITNEPQRNDENLRGLPWYQARSENSFNLWVNDLLKKVGVMPEDTPFIDWMGNRAWLNDPSINSKFLTPYEANPQRGVFNISPDYYSAALFYPVAEIFNERKLRVLSVPIDYHHMPLQAQLENTDLGFAKIRDDQRDVLKREMVGFLQLLAGKPSLIKPK